LSRPGNIGKRYQRALARLRRCGSRIDRLLLGNRIAASECDLLYESVLLNAVARFEGLLNQLLEEFVCGSASRKSGHFPLLSPRSRETFREILTGGRPYIELMPYGRCVEVSQRFLNNGAPFVSVSTTDQALLESIGFIRNAIAHRSDTAMQRFRTRVSGVSSLSPPRRFPGPYLSQCARLRCR